MKKKSIIIFLIFNLTFLYATRTQFLIISQGEENAGTTLEYDYKISNNWQIELGLYGNIYDKAKDLEGTNGSRGNFIGKNTDQVKEYVASIDFLKRFEFKNGLFLLGVGWTKILKKSKQYGHYKFDNSQTYEAFENNIDLEGEHWDVVLGLDYTIKNFKLDIRGRVAENMEFSKIEQYTKLLPSLPTGGKLESSAKFDLSYLITANAYLSFSKIDIGIEGSYRMIPYKYDLKIVNANWTGFVVETQEYDEIETKVLGSVSFKMDMFENFDPVIKFGEYVQKIGEEETKQNIIILGFQKWF